MDFKTFLENFDAIAEAPSGIPKLRSLILDLAVRGKLVPQNPDNTPVKISLEKAQIEKQYFLKKGKIKKEELSLPVELVEAFYKVPEGWLWVRLGEVVNCLDYLRKPVNKDERLLRKGNIPYYGANGQVGWINDFLFDESLVLVVEDETFIGRQLPFCYKVEGKSWVNNHAHVLQPTSAIDIDFLNYSLAYYPFAELTSGTTGRRKLTKSTLLTVPFPVPPIEEQKQIVEKVDELMGLCDRYEAAKQTRDNLRQKLRGSAIASLMNAETDEELDAAWAFVRDNWQNLSQNPGDVDSLRKSVLQLAVRGKLVPQSIDDEIIPKELKKLEIDSNDLLSIPKTWIYVKLKNISDRVSVGHVGETSQFYCTVSEGVPFLRSQNVRPSLLDLTDVKYITKDFHCLLKKSQLQAGDLLFVRVGATRGQCCVVPEGLGNLNCANIVFARSDRKMSKYLQLYCQAPITQSLLLGMTTGSAQGVINTKAVAELPIAIPPLAEQKRIVAKVDELMQLCDQLEDSLRQSQQRAESLAASAISHLTI